MVRVERGDVIWINFDPSVGHEQKGKRPALVISPGAYFTKTGMALLCPISSVEKGYPFELPVHVGDVVGVILLDQIKVCDARARGFKKAGSVTKATMVDAQKLLQKLIF